MKFDYGRDYSVIDFRKNPELYQIGIGEQGVLLVEPYKSEILPYWRFRTPDIAKASAQKIYELFLEYKSQNDFPGMDMARKFLQMGFTRARRYANHKSGKKYVSNPQKEKSKTLEKIAKGKVIPQEDDALVSLKAQSASIFYKYYELAKNDKEYKMMKEKHKTISNN
jgi:hypothetical protein